MGRKIDMNEFLASIEQTDEDRVYMRVGMFDVRLVHTDEGIVVDVYPFAEFVRTGEPIATTYAYDADALEEEDDE